MYVCNRMWGWCSAGVQLGTEWHIRTNTLLLLCVCSVYILNTMNIMCCVLLTLILQVMYELLQISTSDMTLYMFMLFKLHLNVSFWPIIFHTHCFSLTLDRLINNLLMDTSVQNNRLPTTYISYVVKSNREIKSWRRLCRHRWNTNHTITVTSIDLYTIEYNQFMWRHNLRLISIISCT